MPLKQAYYLVCSECKKNFIDDKLGSFFLEAADVYRIARKCGWRPNWLTEFGQVCDYCPDCFFKHVSIKDGDESSN